MELADRERELKQGEAQQQDFPEPDEQPAAHGRLHG